MIGGKFSIIIVDDEPDINLMLELILTDKGYHVETFTEPNAALASFKPGKYSMAILDLKMSPINGFDLYQHFKTMDNDTKVLFLSADREHCSECTKTWPENSSRHYLHKPSEIAPILRHIEELLSYNRIKQAFPA